MIFNSITFLLFLSIVVALYWILGRRARLMMLLIASLTFYGFWRVEFVPVMLVSAATDYFVALKLFRTKSPSHRKMLLATSLTINLGLLFYFKYLMFFLDNASAGATLLGLDWHAPTLSIILPLGISFYTFQTLSYTVDVYRGFIKPERDPILYTTYVTFFPQLVAGPILRASEVIDQLSTRPRFLPEDMGVGIQRILSGLFLKTVLADNIAPLVDTAFQAGSAAHSALDVWTMAFLFGFQIYFDFSAYSHIAIGSARLMGIRFPENFAFPYLADSPRDFWKRWHISLSSWIRDYLYLPLAGERVLDRSTGGLDDSSPQQPGKISTPAERKSHRTRALFVTWAMMGLWHGAAWRFVLWGLSHAVLVYMNRRLKPVASRFSTRSRHVLGIGLTLPLVMLAWIPFRARDLSESLALWSKVVQPSQYTWLGMRENTYMVAALLLTGIVICYALRNPLEWARKHRPWTSAALQAAWATGTAALVFVFLRPISQFIYFQF